MGRLSPETIRPGLDRIREAFELTGHPERAFRMIHIAGTNGKGSVASFLDSILRRIVPGPVGLYTSPHLVAPEERIRVDGEKIPEKELRRRIREAGTLSAAMKPESGPPMTWFEEMTWAACDWFRAAKADPVIMEAGLGGRWDATTACIPEISVITSIGIDHKEWLGNTLREIAGEKAEIIRPEVPLILGKLGGIPRAVATGKAKERRAPVWESGRDFRWEEYGGNLLRIILPGMKVDGIRLAMRGEFQRDNAAVACAAALKWVAARNLATEDFAEAAGKGLASAKWPGRFSRLPGRKNANTWVDGAHNPDAARALSRELRALKKTVGGTRIIALWSMLRDKDMDGFLRELSDSVDGWVVFPMDHERAAPVEELSDACRRTGCGFRTSADFAEGWKAARRWAEKGGTVIVCGSLAAVGEAYRLRTGGLD